MNNQLEDEKLYYIYRHIRTDKNEPFYIGKGTVQKNKKTEIGSHKRAYSSDGRSLFWRKIVKKSKYEVEILFYSNDIKVIQEKETEFIKLYGRRDLGLGPLCNLTDGGEKETGAIRSEELKAFMSTLKRGKFTGATSPHAIPVFAYTLDGNFYKRYECMVDAATDLNLRQRVVSLIAAKNSPEKFEEKGQRAVKGFTFFLDYRGEFFDIPPKRKHGQGLKVARVDENGNILQIFKSLREAGRITGDTKSSIKKCIEKDRLSIRNNRYKFIK